MKLSRLSIVLYMGIVFASGGALGWYGQRFYYESEVRPKQIKSDPKEMRKRIIAEYQRRLSLTADQVTKLEIIFDDTRAQQDQVFQKQLKESFEKTQPERQQIRETYADRIREILNPQQKIEYEQMRKEREEKRQQGKDGGKRGPGI